MGVTLAFIPQAPATAYGLRLIDSLGWGLFGTVDGLRILRQHNAGADMAQVAEHLSVAELQACYRGSKEGTLARHYQVIWLLAQGRTVAEKKASETPFLCGLLTAVK